MTFIDRQFAGKLERRQPNNPTQREFQARSGSPSKDLRDMSSG